MKFLFCALLFFAALSHGAEVKVEEGVLVLTTDNFKTVIKENAYILVDFYTQSCIACLELDEEYAEAAQFLAELEWPIKLGKVDTTVETALAEEYQTRGYPTIKFFRRGVPIEYSGNHEFDDIVEWLHKETRSPVVPLDSVEIVEKYLEDNELTVIGFFRNDSAAARVFLAVPQSSNFPAFGITKDPAVMAKYGAKDGDVLLFKPFDEKVSLFKGKITLKALIKFIEVESMPLIVEFQPEYATKIMHNTLKTHLVFFVSKKAGHLDDHIAQLTEVAKKYRGEVLFVTVSSDDRRNEHLFRQMNITKKELPTFRLLFVTGKNEPLTSEAKSNDISVATITEFLKRFIDRKLTDHDWDSKPVKELAASNFDEVVLDKTKDVLVEFFATECGRCKQLAPIYEQLGEKYQNNDSILIAKIDATADVLSHVSITSFPTIKLFRKEDNKVMDFTLDMTFENFVKFLDAGGAIEMANGSGEELDEEQVKDEL